MPDARIYIKCALGFPGKKANLHLVLLNGFGECAKRVYVMSWLNPSFRQNHFTNKEAGLMNVFRKTVLLMLAFSFTLYLGCGSDESDFDQGNQFLEKAYQSYLDGDPSQALMDVNSSLKYAVTSEALAFKPQVQWVLGDQTAAYDTLATFKALYPNDGLDELLRAYFLSGESGDCDQTLSNLEIALNENLADISSESYWEMVENENGFSYFRNSCPTQYAKLEEMKPTCPSEEPLETCKENVTKFENAVLGPKLWIKDSNMIYLEDVGEIESMILKSAPLPGPAKTSLAAAIKVRSASIEEKNNGCGVVLYWTWESSPELEEFWVTSQNTEGFVGDNTSCVRIALTNNTLEVRTFSFGSQAEITLAPRETYVFRGPCFVNGRFYIREGTRKIIGFAWVGPNKKCFVSQWHKYLAFSTFDEVAPIVRVAASTYKNSRKWSKVGAVTLPGMTRVLCFWLTSPNGNVWGWGSIDKRPKKTACHSRNEPTNRQGIIVYYGSDFALPDPAKVVIP